MHVLHVQTEHLHSVMSLMIAHLIRMMVCTCLIFTEPAINEEERLLYPHESESKEKINSLKKAQISCSFTSNPLPLHHKKDEHNAVLI